MEIDEYINIEKVEKSFKEFKNNYPFDHCICDNFFKKEVAKKLENDFFDYNDSKWHAYLNAIEDKRLLNVWNSFPPTTYKIFSILNSPEFLQLISKYTNILPLYSDPGLNGGGWHLHRKGGKLNVHLDYNIHPKLQLQRKMNLIVYLNSNWQEEWGGQLGLWTQDKNFKKPEKIVKKVVPIFNRAVFFDTTQKSWHGLPEPLECPENEYRKSIAVYYLTTPPIKTEDRGKALFAPTKEQENDPKVLDLIKKRSSVNSAKDVYKSK